MNNEFAELRRQFTIAWMKIGNCPESLCVSPKCCYDFEQLRSQFGIEEVGYLFNPLQKSFYVNERRIEAVVEPRYLSNWSSSFETFDDLRRREAWLMRKPFEEYLEAPRIISEVWGKLNWSLLFQLMEDEEMPPEGRLVIQRTFVQAFVDELFPDWLLEELAKTNT